MTISTSEDQRRAALKGQKRDMKQLPQKAPEQWSDDIGVKSQQHQWGHAGDDKSSYWYEKLAQGAVFSDQYGFGFFPKEAPSSFPKTLAPAADPDENWHIPIR